MIISNALKIEGWMRPAELEWLAEQARTRKLIVEVGSWMGRSTRAIVDNTDGYVYAVDTWNGSDELVHREKLANKSADWLYDQFCYNMADATHEVHAYRTTSLQAAKEFYLLDHPKFDMIFLDASHDYENVKADILAWKPLLAENGLLCGHDYSPYWPGVIRAVNELLPAARPLGLSATSIWYVNL